MRLQLDLRFPSHPRASVMSETSLGERKISEFDSCIDGAPLNRPTTPNASPSISPISSAFLNELKEDGNADVTTIYSYFSTVSTNYTMSNLPGPGRLLGNFYSFAGAVLERKFIKWVAVMSRKPELKVYADAAELLKEGKWVRETMGSPQPRDNDMTCNVLLLGAQSLDIDLQIIAFQEIVHYTALYPYSARPAFDRIFARRKEIGDVVSFSWRRPDIRYSTNWRLWYKLASRCVSKHAPGTYSVVEAAAKLSDQKGCWSFEFSAFEELLLNCSDAADLILTIQFICCYWNNQGLKEYVLRKGLADPALFTFTLAFFLQWEIIYPSRREVEEWPPALLPLIMARHFSDGIWAALHELEQDVLDEMLEDESQLAIFAELSKMQRDSRRYVCIHGLAETFTSMTRTWREVCDENLPNPKNSKLRERLIRLEDLHDDASGSVAIDQL
ncbi:hypothetical protein SCHPADRAFT_615251 [Schizopora paradoxa]|uniref:Uncharacterized protein n=1 Tax=Schizopora paradoxa TaxID=27342 RepID=A0A0H2RTT1_9AGAM|nr:hypothetical protein SCHPADRAFT_615251 [Schizopora paradoxa]